MILTQVALQQHLSPISQMNCSISLTLKWCYLNKSKMSCNLNMRSTLISIYSLVCADLLYIYMTIPGAYTTDSGDVVGAASDVQAFWSNC